MKWTDVKEFVGCLIGTRTPFPGGIKDGSPFNKMSGKDKGAGLLVALALLVLILLVSQ